MTFKQIGKRRWFFVCAMVAACGLVCSCGRGPASWRTYREIEYSAPSRTSRTAADAGGMSGMGGMMSPAAQTASSQPALQWTTPEGWTEERGSGMRMATFTMGDASRTGMCTIVMLGGAAGGLEANVVRWLGQLGLQTPPDDDLQAFLRRQITFATAGGFETVAVDLTELAPPGNDAAGSMLSSIISADGSTCFVKLTGPAGLLKAEKNRFLELCRSLRKGP